MRHPRMVAEDVFVVAGDDIDPVARLETPQRLYVRASRIDGAVDQISSYGDQVDAELVRSLDDDARPRRGEQPAYVEVGQLQDRVAVE